MKPLQKAAGALPDWDIHMKDNNTAVKKNGDVLSVPMPTNHVLIKVKTKS